MAIPSCTKQPSESRLYSMDFSALLADGETISGVTSVVVDKITLSPIVLGTASFSGVLAQVRISGGLGGTIYKVTFVVTTSLSNVLEGEGLVNVEDI